MEDHVSDPDDLPTSLFATKKGKTSPFDGWGRTKKEECLETKSKKRHAHEILDNNSEEQSEHSKKIKTNN
jgi:hypothetical protein